MKFDVVTGRSGMPVRKVAERLCPDIGRNPCRPQERGDLLMTMPQCRHGY